MRKLAFISLLLLLVALPLIAVCGDDGDNDIDGTPTPSPAEAVEALLTPTLSPIPTLTPVETPTPTPVVTPTPSPSPSPSPTPTLLPATFELVPGRTGIFYASARVSNIGDEAGEYTFEVLLDNKPMQLEWIEVDNILYQNPHSWAKIDQTVMNEDAAILVDPNFWQYDPAFGGYTGIRNWVMFPAGWQWLDQIIWAKGYFTAIGGNRYAKRTEQQSGLVTLDLKAGQTKLIDFRQEVENELALIGSTGYLSPHVLAIDGHRITLNR